jgi:hypothetical protein
VKTLATAAVRHLALDLAQTLDQARTTDLAQTLGLEWAPGRSGCTVLRPLGLRPLTLRAPLSVDLTRRS